MAVLNFFDTLALQPDFFSEATIDERIDRDKLKDVILRRCGDLMPIYTDTRMFMYFSNTFFYEREKTICRLLDTIDLEYNPIENYNRTETVDRTSTLSAGISTTDTYRLSETDTPATTVSVKTTPATSEEELVSPFDSIDYQPKSKTVQAGEVNSTTTNSGQDNKVIDTINTEARSGKDETTDKTRIEVSGNIGVTTTQQMIKREREVSLFNVYNWIAIEFEQNFFICVS